MKHVSRLFQFVEDVIDSHPLLVFNLHLERSLIAEFIHSLDSDADGPYCWNGYQVVGNDGGSDRDRVEACKNRLLYRILPAPQYVVNDRVELNCATFQKSP